jgi:hypothetical protein
LVLRRREFTDHDHANSWFRRRADVGGLVAGTRDPLEAAVFDFELLDTSLQGEGPQADEQRRLKDVAEQLRKALADAGKFVVLDIAPVNAAAHASNLQACGGCDVQYAQQLGADLAITGLVQKVSALILNMNIYLRMRIPDASLRP